MKIHFSKNQIVNCVCPVLIIPIYKGEKFDKNITQVDKKIGGFISAIIKEGYYTPEHGTVHVVYTHEKIISKKIVLCGMGQRKEITAEKIYRSISKAVAYVGKTQVKKCAIYLADIKKELFGNIIQTSVLALYEFNRHKSKTKHKKLLELCFYIDTSTSEKELDIITKKSQIIADAIYIARDLANEPGNILTPVKFANNIKNIFNKSAVNISVIGEEEIKKLGMGLISAVSKGSDEDAQLIIIDYIPHKYNKTIVLVGKGLTFDSGGLSLKPSDGMIGMHMDMSGAAAVAGTMSAIYQLKPKNIRIVGVIGATENMPGHCAQRPGDVWKSYKGKTVEVLNTDAEGRLVLADLMSYAQATFKPDYLIDIATLTGACMVALGSNYAGLFGNNKLLIEKITQLSYDNYEKSWLMPMDDDFHEEMKGEIADLKNIGNGKEGGACTAAAFLEEFIDPKVKWAHLDIAGPSMIQKNNIAYLPKGASGTGTKTLIELINLLNE